MSCPPADTTGRASEESVTKLLTDALEPTHLTVTDESDGCGAKFSVVVVSAKFEPLAPLDRQRAVHTALGDLMKGIHAISMKTWTPEQYAKRVAAGTA